MSDIGKKNVLYQNLSVKGSYPENLWVVKKETPNYFLLAKNKASLKIHIMLLLLTGWWTFFIPNLLYMFIMNKRKKIYKHSNRIKDRKHL